MTAQLNHTLLATWLTRLQANNLSENTLQAYQRDVAALLNFLEDNELLWQDLTLPALQSYVAQRLERDALSTASVQRELSAVRQFYRWLDEQGVIQKNPLLGFKIKRPPRPLPELIDYDKVSQLLDQPEPESPKQAELWVRDKAILELLYGSGLRVSELVNINQSDIDTARFQVRVTGKGNKMRVVPLGSKSIAALQSWYRVRALWLAQLPQGSVHAVFISQQRKQRLSVRAVEKRLEILTARAGIDQRVYPHLLRHCFASHMLSNSGDLRGVQELLGHENIATTQIYTHLDFEKLVNVYDGAHPRAKRRND